MKKLFDNVRLDLEIWRFHQRVCSEMGVSYFSEYSRALHRKWCRKAFTHGFIGRETPRCARRFLAKTRLHRYWLRGTMTNWIEENGQCVGRDGRLLPFNTRH